MALILWAVQLVIRDYSFAFTHGTTAANMGRSLLGFSAYQFAVLWTVFVPLGFVGFAGVYLQTADRLGNVGKSGFFLALAGFALLFVASEMQYWILNTDNYFHSPVVYGGWLLSIVSVFVLSAGLVLAGIGVYIANALPRGRPLILIIGLVSLPTALLHPYVVGRSDGSLATQLIYGSLSVPYALLWLRLGLLRFAAASRLLPG